MKANQFILISHGLTLTVVAMSAEGQIARQVDVTWVDAPRTLRSLGYSAGPVLLAVPSRDCLCATVDVSGQSKVDRRRAIFRLEESLPWAAEESTVDFSRATIGKTSLAIAIRNHPLREWISALESDGVQIEFIIPTAILAAQELSHRDAADMVLIGFDDGVDVIAIQSGQPVAWGWSGTDVAAIQLQFTLAERQLRLKRVPKVLAVDVDAAISPQAKKSERRAIELLARSAASVLSGHRDPWINLRRDALATSDPIRLYRGALNLALAAVAMLLLSISAVSIINMFRNQHRSADAEQKMSLAFQQQFPDFAPPANIPAVVQSERQKRVESSSAGKNATVSTMRSVIAAIPADLRLSIDTMGFGSTAFDMTGRVNDQVDLESLTTAMRAAKLDVAPGRARHETSGAWAFSLSGVAAEPQHP